MAERFPGGVISKTPPTVSGPDFNTSGSASGVWTLDEVLGYVKAGKWPGETLPRSIFAFGRNAYGALGDGTTVFRSSPVQIGSDTDWQSVSTGGLHAVAVKSTGSLWSWGTNFNGQVGDNTVVSKSSPVQIGALTTWSQVTAGQYHTNAIKSDGTLWGWGENQRGSVGDGTQTGRSSPVQIGALSDWASVNAGGRHTMAVKTDGTLWGWGFNGLGQLGSGTYYDRSSPTQVGALTTWQNAAGGGLHSLGIKTDGTIWSWGQNADGQLGVSPSAYISRSTPIQVGTLTTWSKIQTGGLHSCAIKNDGTLWMWGLNDKGQLGDNTTSARSSPVQVGSLTSWEEVKGGQRHTLAIANGALYSWGANNAPNGAAIGQLGQNDVVLRSSPTQVGTSSFKVVSVSAGASSSNDPGLNSMVIGTVV